MGFLLSLRHAVYNLSGVVAHRKGVRRLVGIAALVTGTIEMRQLCGCKELVAHNTTPIASENATFLW